MELTKQEKECFAQCSGECDLCMLDGGCDLQNKLREVE